MLGLGTLLVLASCSAVPAHRSLASLNEFPSISSAGYSSISWEKRLKSGTLSPVADDNEQLNRAFEEVTDGVLRLLRNPKVPRPRMILVNDPSINARVDGAYSCAKTSLQIGGALPNTKVFSVAEMSINSLDKPEVSSASAAVENLLYIQPGGAMWPCLEQLSESESRDFAADLSRSQLFFQNQACMLNSTNPVLRFSCPLLMSAKTTSIVFQRTMPFVLVNTGLVAALNSFDEFKAIIAHELGHYYLGHVYTPKIPRSYFYDRSAPGQSFRPPEDPNLFEAGNLLLALGKAPRGQTLPELFRNPFSGEVLLTATQALRYDKSGAWDFDRKKCAEFFDQAGQNAQRFLYSESASSDAGTKWRDYFERLRECTKTVVARAGKDQTYVSYFTRIPPRANVMPYLLRGFRTEPHRNAWDAFLAVEAVISEKLNKIGSDEFLRKLGYYTLEEEADIFALNYLMTYGYSPASMQSALANMTRLSLASGKTSANEKPCLEAYDNGWMLHGKSYTPLPTSYDDPHHSLCFRLYDVSRMAKELGPYDAADSKTTDGGFAAIRNRYRQLSGFSPK